MRDTKSVISVTCVIFRLFYKKEKNYANLDESKKVYASYRIYSNIRICACGDYESDIPCAKFENIDTTAGTYQCLIDKFALYTDEAKNEDDYNYYAYIDTDTYDRMRFTSHTFTDLSGIYGTNPAMVMNLGSSSEWSEAYNKHLALFENKDDIEGDLPSSTIAPSDAIKDNEPDKDYIILYIHCS